MNTQKTSEIASITMPFGTYVKAYYKAIRKNPKAKTLTVTLPLSNRVNAFRSNPHRVTAYERYRWPTMAWTAGGGTISIPLSRAGRAAKRREHNAQVRGIYVPQKLVANVK